MDSREGEPVLIYQQGDHVYPIPNGCAEAQPANLLLPSYILSVPTR